MTDHAQRPPEEHRAETDRGKDQRRRPDDPAEPEWVLERIQQTFETRRG